MGGGGETREFRLRSAPSNRAEQTCFPEEPLCGSPSPRQPAAPALPSRPALCPVATPPPAPCPTVSRQGSSPTSSPRSLRPLWVALRRPPQAGHPYPTHLFGGGRRALFCPPVHQAASGIRQAEPQQTLCPQLVGRAFEATCCPTQSPWVTSSQHPSSPGSSGAGGVHPKTLRSGQASSARPGTHAEKL